MTSLNPLTLIQNQKLPQVSLLCGRDDTCLTETTCALARMLLCLSADKQSACGTCSSCKLFEAGNHPDFLTLAPDNSSESKADPKIKIEQVRTLLPQLAMTAQVGTRQVIRILNADQMTTQAANALLKTIEEPRVQQVFLLTATHWSRVLPTIRSRCARSVIPATIAQSTTLTPREEWLARACEGSGDRFKELTTQTDTLDLIDALMQTDTPAHKRYDLCAKLARALPSLSLGLQLITAKMLETQTGQPDTRTMLKLDRLDQAKRYAEQNLPAEVVLQSIFG